MPLNPNNSRHSLFAAFAELDEATLTAGFDHIFIPPWLSTHPRIVAAWESLTRPERLSDLEERWAEYDNGAAMNPWAAEATGRAIEESRRRSGAPEEPDDVIPPER
jgi:hypothetical protein